MQLRTTFVAVTIVCSVVLFGGATSAREKEPLTPAELADRTMHRRAIDAVIWGMPAVNFDRLNQAMHRTGRAQSSHLLVAPARLEKPNAHSESRHDLPDAVLQHPGRSGCLGDSAGR